MLRPLMAICDTCLSVMTLLISPESDCTAMALASTVMVSAVVPTFIWKSTRNRSPTCRTMSLCSATLKPAASALTSYFPIWMSGATYCPESLVGYVRVQLVAEFVTVMFTLGITAPDGSVTVPTMVAFCANDTDGSINNNKNNNGRYFKL